MALENLCGVVTPELTDIIIPIYRSTALAHHKAPQRHEGNRFIGKERAQINYEGNVMMNAGNDTASRRVRIMLNISL
jgi:hypothetical protein